MFGLFSNKKEIEAEVKPIIEKKVACEELIYKVLHDRIVNKKDKFSADDYQKLSPEIQELYNLIMESPKKIREHVITNVFGMEKSKFNFVNFFELMRLTIFIRLTEEGKIKG